MTKARLTTIFLLLIFSQSFSQTTDQRQILIDLANSRSAALVNSDTLKMKEILDDNFFYVNSEGVKRNRKEYIKNIILSGDSKWLEQKIEDMDVRLVGTDAAILSFIVLDRFVYNGEEYAVYNRSTFVYGRKGKTWKCMSGHTTEIGEKK